MHPEKMNRKLAGERPDKAAADHGNPAGESSSKSREGAFLNRISNMETDAAGKREACENIRGF